MQSQFNTSSSNNRNIQH